MTPTVGNGRGFRAWDLGFMKETSLSSPQSPSVPVAQQMVQMRQHPGNLLPCRRCPSDPPSSCDKCMRGLHVKDTTFWGWHHNDKGVCCRVEDAALGASFILLWVHTRSACEVKTQKLWMASRIDVRAGCCHAEDDLVTNFILPTDAEKICICEEYT